jgi:hypothetical protein
MATQVLTNARLWVDAFDFSGDVNKIALNYSADLLDATAFLTPGGKARKGGLKDATLAAEGFWNGGADQVDEVLFGKIGLVSVPVTSAPTIGLAGDPAFSFRAGFASYTPGASVGEMFKFSVDASESDDVPVRGILLRNSVESGNGNGAAFAQGLVGSGQKLYASLHVLAVSGGGTWTFKVQSDDAGGFGTPTDRITFNAVTVKGSQWAVPVVGPIASDNQWRANWSVAGGAGNSITFVMFLGIQ